MVFRLGLNGLYGAGKEPSFGSLGFGVFSCPVLDVALRSCGFSAGNGTSGIAEQVVILRDKLYEVWIHLDVHTHELHSFPLAADHLFRFAGGLTSGRRGVYRAGPPKGCLNLGLHTLISAT